MHHSIDSTESRDEGYCNTSRKFFGETDLEELVGVTMWLSCLAMCETSKTKTR